MAPEEPRPLLVSEATAGRWAFIHSSRGLFPSKAQCAGSTDLASLPFPPMKAKPTPFHALRRPGIEAAVAWKRMLDAWETRWR